METVKNRIIIADDHMLFNDGIKGMLESENDLQVVAQIFSGDKVLQSVISYRPAILLLDINMPGKTGMELIEVLKKECPSTSIAMLSMYSDSRFVQECRRIKVNGYVLKNASKEKLIFAIRAILSGESYYDPALNMQNNPHQDDEFMKKFKLTKRELEIINLVKDNYTAQDIARSLFLSVFTVETHRRNINLKLGVKNTLGLIKFAAEQGI